MERSDTRERDALDYLVFVGRFEPGNLVFMAPNLPHNWVSNLGAGEHVGARDLVLQFSRPFADRMLGAIPELSPLQDLLEGAARGLQFPDALGRSIVPLMQDLAQASGARRVVLMMSVLEQLASNLPWTTALGKAYYNDPAFACDKQGEIDLWRVFNLFTGANKSSYIDSFLTRSRNAMVFADGLAKALAGEKEYSWFVE